MLPLPEFLESFWLERARRATGQADNASALERLRSAVRRLSDLFTTERPAGSFPDYFGDDSLLTAYGLFFFPQSFARARLAFDSPVRFREWTPPPAAPGMPAAPSAPAALAPLRVLDLGGGAGPCGLAIAAALHEIAPERPILLTVADHSAVALAALREIARAGADTKSVSDFFGSLTVETVMADLRREDAVPETLPPQDVVVAGFCANELVTGGADSLAHWLEAWRGRLAPRGLLLVLEPDLRETSLRLRGAADALVAKNVFHEWAPALGPRSAPAAAAAADPAANADLRFHPHEVRAWTPPESLAFLNRELFRETGVLKFSFAALGLETPPALANPEEILRLVSPLEILKGRIVCAAENVSGARLTVEIPTRGLSKSDAKRLAAAHERGDVLRVNPARLRPVGLPAAATFRLDAPDALRVAYAPAFLF